MRKFLTRIITSVSALLIIGLSVGFAYGMNRVALKLPLRQNFTTAYTATVWDWTGPAATNGSITLTLPRTGPRTPSMATFIFSPVAHFGRACPPPPKSARFENSAEIPAATLARAT